VTEPLIVLVLALPLLTAACTLLARTPRQADAASIAGALATAGVALGLAGAALVQPDSPALGDWYVLDAASGVFLAVAAVVGLLSALASPLQLAGEGRGLVSAARARGLYYAAFHCFWAALLAVPLVDNLAIAWLLVEATTGASALLVAFSGRRSALEAGWKYLVLTTFGLAVALLGIILLYVLAVPDGGDLATLDWRSIAAVAPTLPEAGALTAFVLIIAGLATKAGWAPVHNWLPDAHSEAPPPASALLSAALLPAVALVAWRVLIALQPGLAPGTGGALFIAFGLLSLAVAVPFLWTALPWKRLLAYSSLEHMGVLALAIGFANPLATAGAIVHVAGHALAKALGFYAATPLLRHIPEAHRLPVRGLAAASRESAAAVGISLAALAAFPPSPLFVSELLILLGGIAAGELAVTIVAATLLALGFLGLAHALIEGLVGEPRPRRWRAGRSARQIARLTVVCGVGMLAITVAACFLPGSDPIELFMRGIA
jgi:hydrogenase-4 component F